MLDNRCTVCITYGVECTYQETSKVWEFLLSTIQATHPPRYRKLKGERPFNLFLISRTSNCV